MYCFVQEVQDSNLCPQTNHSKELFSWFSSFLGKIVEYSLQIDHNHFHILCLSSFMIIITFDNVHPIQLKILFSWPKNQSQIMINHIIPRLIRLITYKFHKVPSWITLNHPYPISQSPPFLSPLYNM